METVIYILMAFYSAVGVVFGLGFLLEALLDN
jgi:hypothetical protein